MNDSSKVVLGKLIDPKQIIEKTLPESNFVISNLITQTDNGKASLIVIKTSDHLQVSRLDVVDNGNTGFLFYKQHFYKQQQGEIGKKKNPAKSKQHPETELLLFASVFIFFIQD